MIKKDKIVINWEIKKGWGQVISLHQLELTWFGRYLAQTTQYTQPVQINVR